MEGMHSDDGVTIHPHTHTYMYMQSHRQLHTYWYCAETKSSGGGEEEVPLRQRLYTTTRSTPHTVSAHIPFKSSLTDIHIHTHVHMHTHLPARPLIQEWSQRYDYQSYTDSDGT